MMNATAENVECRDVTLKVRLNGFVRDRLRIFWKRKHNAETRGLGRLSGRTLAKLGLYQFAYAKA